MKDSLILTGGSRGTRTLWPPRGVLDIEGCFPRSLRLFASFVATRSSGLAVPLAWTVPQRWASVMVTAVERSAVADALGSMHGFPAALTSFVGRAGVVDEVAGQLGQYRLVTVTGPGGAGKTRLAGEVAGRFADGVWLAELAAVRNPAQVAAAVAAALGSGSCPRWRRPMRWRARWPGSSCCWC